MKKFIVNEVVPNQEYTIEPYDENEAKIKGALNTIQDIVNDIHKELFGDGIDSDEEDDNKHFYSFSEEEWENINHIRDGLKARINHKENKEFFDNISDTDGFEKFKKDFGHEICDDQMLGTHKFINLLFRNYFRFTAKDESFLNNIEDLLHMQALEKQISLFEFFDRLNLIDYRMDQGLLNRTLTRFSEIIWNEENQLDISINVMSPADENDTAEFYIVFNSAPKWIR